MTDDRANNKGLSSMMPKQLRTDMVVSEVLEKWPQTATVFNEFKTACVGCAMSPFDTLADVARRS